MGSIKKGIVRNLILRNLVTAGFWLERASDSNEIQKTLRLFQPNTTEHDLIRFGDGGDGGYLVPDDLKGVVACFSPGVDGIANFEKSCLERGIICILADKTVENPPLKSKYVHFTRKHLGALSDKETMTLDEWVRMFEQSIPSGDYLLQMDIEASEYETILASPDSLLAKFRILVIEFHLLEYLNSWGGNLIVRQTMQKILNNFTVVHVHANNAVRPFLAHKIEVPSLLEVTFLRKDRHSLNSPNTNVYHKLDSPNVSEKPEVYLNQLFANISKNNRAIND